MRPFGDASSYLFEALLASRIQPYTIASLAPQKQRLSHHYPTTVASRVFPRLSHSCPTTFVPAAGASRACFQDIRLLLWTRQYDNETATPCFGRRCYSARAHEQPARRQPHALRACIWFAGQGHVWRVASGKRFGVHSMASRKRFRVHRMAALSVSCCAQSARKRPPCAMLL